MEKLYASPWRVYLVVALLAAIGIAAGLNLPISLFPNSSKPSVRISVDTGSMTGEEFMHTYGTSLESQLLVLKGDRFEADNIEATYRAQAASYTVNFKWGDNGSDAFREVERLVNAYSARFPQELRDGTNVWLRRGNTGFFALSYYSEKRSPTEVYDLVEPLVMSRVAMVRDAANPELYNPASQEVQIVLKPQALVSLRLLPTDILAQIRSSLRSYAAGTVQLGRAKLSVQVPRGVESLEDFRRIPIPVGSEGSVVPLGRLADIDVGPSSFDSSVFKTSGFSSLILFASPKPDGNIKKMAEDILLVVRAVEPQLPADVHSKVLVDPSEFIRQSINNVLHEVGLAALLAVVVLYLFIGSLKNVATAAIEIPLSMVLAFVFMKIFGVNLNLISLGGLALSAGMNVDASVVVMENIFRHFEDAPGPHDFRVRLRIISEAVREVRGAVISSTIASLVVFAPLIFTSDLSYAILGDLAKAIVFSHGCSAFVALLLVPTIRLQIMGGSALHHAESGSPIEKILKALESGYVSSLDRVLRARKGKVLGLLGVGALIVVSAFAIVPHLKREVVGKPDTDWILVSVDTSGNRLVQQMVSSADEIEAQVLRDFGSKISYTFNQIENPNSATLMARLKDKRDMKEVWKGIEKAFPDTPFLKFNVFPWNPSEFSLPDPPQLDLSIAGGDDKTRLETARSIKALRQEKQLYPRVNSTPDVDPAKTLLLRPQNELIARLQAQGHGPNLSALAFLPFFSTSPQRVDSVNLNGRSTPITVQFPSDTVQTPEDVGALPIGLGSKVIPLKALFGIEVADAQPSIYRKNQRELIEVTGRLDQDFLDRKEANLSLAQQAIETWKKSQEGTVETPSGEGRKSLPASIHFEDADLDLNTALRQLGLAVALSISLIFLILLLQFGNLVYAGIVLVAIPLGFLGVTLSLFVFRSTLSLNSILGVILLNGISVANSILLVDFIDKLYASGRTAHEAGLEAAAKRLRPILITSLTTILGMLPVAIGLGEGGRVLQPLGIAVSGGLWVSMVLTLYIVPMLQVAYLERKVRV